MWRSAESNRFQLKCLEHSAAAVAFPPCGMLCSRTACLINNVLCHIKACGNSIQLLQYKILVFLKQLIIVL